MSRSVSFKPKRATLVPVAPVAPVALADSGLRVAKRALAVQEPNEAVPVDSVR